MRTHTLSGSVFAVIFGCLGCSGPQTGTLSGEITYRGKPVETGTVIVSRGDGNYRNVRFVPVSSGRYQASGLVPGDHWVTLTDSREVVETEEGIPGLPVKTTVLAGENTLDVSLGDRRR